MNNFNVDSLDSLREKLLASKNENLERIRHAKYMYESACNASDNSKMKYWSDFRKEVVQKDQEYNMKLSEIKDLKRRLYNRDFQSIMEQKIKERLGDSFFSELREEVLREMYNDEQELKDVLNDIFTPEELGLVNN